TWNAQQKPTMNEKGEWTWQQKTINPDGTDEIQVVPFTGTPPADATQQWLLTRGIDPDSEKGRQMAEIIGGIRGRMEDPGKTARLKEAATAKTTAATQKGIATERGKVVDLNVKGASAYRNRWIDKETGEPKEGAPTRPEFLKEFSADVTPKAPTKPGVEAPKEAPGKAVEKTASDAIVKISHKYRTGGIKDEDIPSFIEAFKKKFPDPKNVKALLSSLNAQGYKGKAEVPKGAIFGTQKHE
ncbi:unnamed protein product, partial [marine sediment metagenome]